ncbi:uncharacterized protein LOC110035518 isoform X2 [Phalaenopsis equestris]|uniref:uncharacterized protein LOC110035518 isoform X2 n=1 Tax=Phalaenopsis equestris TaxID=78828 RepID=UPI0009E5F0EC|nr:uncharacterized protein LOC110035518 isoform X2 [Phalaenopsis equestris]
MCSTLHMKMMGGQICNDRRKNLKPRCKKLGFINSLLPHPSSSPTTAALQVRMEVKMASSIVILLVSLMFADARYGKEPELNQEGNSICNSCLEASRMAERALKEWEPFKELDKLSGNICSVLPVNFELQCLEKTKKQIHHTKLSFQELFHEKSLCNSRDLCADHQILQEIKIAGENKSPPELEDERDCIACRRAVRELVMKMNQPKMKTKIIEALIDYCEETEDNEDQCKRRVKKYVPTVLIKLEKLKPTDICLMMGMCDERYGSL